MRQRAFEPIGFATGIMNIGCGMVRIAHDRKPYRSTETIASSCSNFVEEANSPYS